MSQLNVLLALVFAILIAVFAVQNTTPVGVSFLTFHTDSVAVSVLVLISAALGAAVMVLLGIWREARLRWRQRAVAQQLKTAQARVAELEAGAVSPQPSAVSDSAAVAPTAELPQPTSATQTREATTTDS